MSFCHRSEDAADEAEGDLLMEEVTHRVHEDKSWAAPFERSLDQMRMERNVESVSVVRIPHGLEPVCHPLGIAVETSSASL